jgi:hypothetical protein
VVRDIVREYDHETEHVGAYLYQGDYFEHPPGEPIIYDPPQPQMIGRTTALRGSGRGGWA